ncbi:translationally-controlled tumor protein [Trichophaea hybrida]|nr:translationally-controlled tumor protein [Trichophaea hybrida]
MIIYKDTLTGDEMISDVYDLKEIDGVLYEADCQMITIKKGADVDIGANASAEETAEELEDGAEVVNNIAYSFRLNQTTFDKKSYLTYLKGYMKSVKKAMQDAGKSEDDVVAFEKGAQAAAKKLIANFKDLEFYTGESMNPDGMIALLNYREDGTTPYFIFWKHGLKEEKV